MSFPTGWVWDFAQSYIYISSAVFALRFQNLPARNSSLKIFKHEKEEKLAGPAQFLVAEGLGPGLNAKTASAMLLKWEHIFKRTNPPIDIINDTLIHSILNGNLQWLAVNALMITVLSNLHWFFTSFSIEKQGQPGWQSFPIFVRQGTMTDA